MALIETKNLSVYYGRQRGIHKLNLSVKSGEVYGFLGPNAAGKTTTLRVLMDIIRPTTGHARIFGLDCQQHGMQIRQRVGYLPGELKLYPQTHAADYFQMVSAVRGKGHNQPKTAELCKRLGLDPNRPMKNYSTGNKQKVGLITAFMSHPELLILDEPTTGLDPLTQQTVLDLVTEVRDDGRTVFFSSHILSEVQKVCDRVGIIRNGQIVATERVEKLLKRQFHRFRFRFDEIPPEDAFSDLAVRELYRQGREIVIEIHENLNALMAQAATYGIVDLEEQPATLEEIFLAYYGANEGNHHV